jgi:hypothetical protein
MTHDERDQSDDVFIADEMATTVITSREEIDTDRTKFIVYIDDDKDDDRVVTLQVFTGECQSHFRLTRNQASELGMFLMGKTTVPNAH